MDADEISVFLIHAISHTATQPRFTCRDRDERSGGYWFLDLYASPGGGDIFENALHSAGFTGPGHPIDPHEIGA